VRALIVALVISAVSAAAGVNAAAVDVVVRSRLEPSTDVVVGQPVHLLVDVLFPDTMSRPPLVKLGDVQGAQVFRFETQAVTTSDNFRGRDYVGKRFEFVVFPRRSGELMVPGAEVTLLDSAGNPSGAKTGEILRVHVAAPPGIDASVPVIASSKVEAGETWTPDPSARFKLGEALVRTIKRQSTDVPALAMTDFAFTAPAGVRVYVDAPQVDDRVVRGSVTGSRIDKVTYVFEKPGAYDIPNLEQRWWDLVAKQAQSERLPGARVTVIAGVPAKTATKPTDSSARRWTMPIGLGFALLAVSILAWRVFPAARRALREGKKRRAGSERAARRALCGVASTGDAAATYRALKVWCNRLPTGVVERLTANGDFARVVVDLEETLFGSKSAWSHEQGQKLADFVSRFRWRGLIGPSSPRLAHALPPLNPGRRASDAKIGSSSRARASAESP
jgi:hypothetical protein